MADDTYLFIDGEYLRQIHRQAMLDFFSVEGELDIFEAKRNAGAIRAFFYDSIDETPRPKETEEECHARVAPLQDFVRRTSALSGVHVRLGTVTGKRRRQKEVDILLATDMLTHGFNGSMKTAVLLTGDLDFRPIVEALVRSGVFVEVWYHHSSVAAELPGAADFGRQLRFRQLYSWNTESFKQKHRIPGERGTNRASVRSGQLIRTGSLYDGQWAVELYRWYHAEQAQFRLWIHTGEWESIVVDDEDPDLIERYVNAQYAQLKWERDEQEIREMTERAKARETA